MCIAIYSLKGNDIPKEEYLKNSFIANPDGAGFAFNTDDRKVRIIKGLMNWDSFITTFRKYEKKYGFKNRGVLIHFRITTHGGTNPECTHPFPIIADEGALHKTRCISNYACIHNGVISLTSNEAYRRIKMSDTMVFVEKYLSKIATNRRWFKNDVNFELLYELLDSKMAVLNGNGEIKSTYGFTKDADGNYYSNTSYKEERQRYKISYNYDYYDGYEDYYDDYNCLKSKSVNKVQLMKLEPSDILLLDNFDDCTYEIDTDYYISEDGSCYMSDKNKHTNSQYIWDELYYIGEGVMCDKFYNEKEFKMTNYSYENSIICGLEDVDDDISCDENSITTDLKNENITDISKVLPNKTIIESHMDGEIKENKEDKNNETDE